ncbi:hypothetical protein ACSNOI_41885 [Actinomadura kijaniata]|uniref:hypothetical protein n=1 Tax=Actinomadura kijaniata TaxID=46161 RepID=UPI003F1CCD71
MIDQAVSPDRRLLTFVSGFWQAGGWLFLAAIVAGAGTHDLTSGGSPGVLAFEALLVAYLVTMYFLERRRATVVSTSGLELRGYLLAESIPWGRVVDVRASRRWGMRRVALLLTDGRVRLLTAPRDHVFEGDRDLDVKIEAIREARPDRAAAPAALTGR